MTDSQEKLLMTLPDFCGLYSISRTKAYGEMKAARLRPTHVGRRCYIASQDARAWLEALRANEHKQAA